MNKKNLLAYLLLTPLYVFTGMCIYWMILNLYFPPFKINEVEYIPRVVTEGQEITAVVDIERTRPCHYFIARYMENGIKLLLSSYDILHNKGHDKNYIIRMEIPHNVSSGNYTITTEIQAVCNLWDHFFPINMPKISFPIVVDNTPIKDQKDVIINKDPIKVGDSIELEISGNKTRICSGNISRFIYRNEDNVLINKNTRATYSSVGRFVTREQVKFNLPAGNYTLKTFSTQICSDKIYNITYPEVSFSVINA